MGCLACDSWPELKEFGKLMNGAIQRWFQMQERKCERDLSHLKFVCLHHWKRGKTAAQKRSLGGQLQEAALSKVEKYSIPLRGSLLQVVRDLLLTLPSIGRL